MERQKNKPVSEEEEPLSVCCGYPPVHADSDICSNPKCHEHTDFLTEKEMEDI